MSAALPCFTNNAELRRGPARTVQPIQGNLDFMEKEIELLRRKFREGRAAMFEGVDWESWRPDLLKAHASLVDELLGDIYAASCRQADRQATRSGRAGLAVVATGGYGRGELNPYSDIDIAFIPSEEEDPWVEALIHRAFKMVMDVFLSLRDIHVGYAFRPIAEANAWDITTKTALLDMRHVCGDRTLSDRLALHVRQILSPLDIMLEAQSAESRTESAISMYSVEPNLKEGPGALRDLHRARWIFKLLLGVDDRSLEQALRERAGVPERQIIEVREAADWFWRARTWLHLAAGKPSEVLINNYQDRIARELGGRRTQEWLAEHLAHAEALARFRETAVHTLLRGPLMLSGALLENAHLHRSGDVRSPATDMQLLLAVQRYSIPLGFDELKRLGESRKASIAVKGPSEEEIWTFNRMLNEPSRIAPTMRSLVGFGLMDRFIPRFSEVMRFVPPDPAHSYTVGEHSLRMVEHLENLRAGRDPGGMRFTDLLGECAHFDVLCLAALLHDAGKLAEGGDHCQTGAELAKSVAAKLNLAPEKCELLDILVRQHLLLVRTARLQDLKSPHVIQQLAERTASLEALRHLYVLTYVDTRAVSDGNWTSMDVRDLEDLYQRLQEFFTRQSLDVPDPAAPADPGVREAQESKEKLIRNKLAALQARNSPALLKHCEAMPASYILNTPLEEIAFHLQLLDRLRSETVAFDTYNRPGDDYSELTLCTFDDPAPGMLAKIAGVLYGCGVDIHKAQVFTMAAGRRVLLDMLWVRANGLQLSESKARKIQVALKDVLTGARTIDEFLQKAGKAQTGRITIDSIDLRNDLSEEHTVVHIVAHDLQGLLYLMTRSISRCGLNIHAAKIATWNARAENNFHVTKANGERLPDDELQAWTDCLARALQGD